MLNIILYCSSTALASILKESQNYVYLGVQQTAYVEVAAKTFAHLHSLSLNWHLTKKTGSAMRSMDRGIESANTVVKYLFMYLFPTIIEAIVVCVIFYLKFNSVSFVCSGCS
jgi:ABC-type transport system involved in Fe-S cluster assembly fused permease/ATPase subunit